MWKKALVYSTIGTLTYTLFGEQTEAFTTLIIFMSCDWLSGMIVAAMKKSNKTKNHGLSSSVGFVGLMKKSLMLLSVIIAYRVSLYTGKPIRDIYIIALSCNEALSVIENVGLAGIKLPSFLKKTIEVLNNEKSSENIQQRNTNCQP